MGEEKSGRDNDLNLVTLQEKENEKNEKSERGSLDETSPFWDDV